MFSFVLFFRTNCLRGQRILQVCKMIETFLEEESEYFRGLGVTIITIGSLTEGTRIGIVNEADCFLMLQKLKAEYFELVENSATQYRVTKLGQSKLPDHFIDEEENLNYYNLFSSLLLELSKFFHIKTLPEGMTANINFRMCNDCGQGEGAMDHLKHCQNCLPGVTYTKAGACTILNDEGIDISIDLIPTLPCIKPDPIQMFNKVTLALIEGSLPNWLAYLKKFVKSDSLLPEVLGSSYDQEVGFTAMKLLHAESDENMFILRPGQKLAMADLKEPKLKMSYCYLKALKELMETGLSSFSLKKVLLLEDFTQQTYVCRDGVEVLFAAVNHPHFKSVFEGLVIHDPENEQNWEIDFDAWQTKVENFAKKSERQKSMREFEYKRIPLKKHFDIEK